MYKNPHLAKYHCFGWLMYTIKQLSSKKERFQSSINSAISWYVLRLQKLPQRGNLNSGLEEGKVYHHAHNEYQNERLCILIN